MYSMERRYISTDNKNPTLTKQEEEEEKNPDDLISSMNHTCQR
jgi:hypothetical protein